MAGDLKNSETFEVTLNTVKLKANEDNKGEGVSLSKVMNAWKAIFDDSRVFTHWVRFDNTMSDLAFLDAGASKGGFYVSCIL